LSKMCSRLQLTWTAFWRWHGGKALLHMMPPTLNWRFVAAHLWRR